MKNTQRHGLENGGNRAGRESCGSRAGAFLRRHLVEEPYMLLVAGAAAISITAAGCGGCGGCSCGGEEDEHAAVQAADGGVKAPAKAPPQKAPAKTTPEKTAGEADGGPAQGDASPAESGDAGTADGGPEAQAADGGPAEATADGAVAPAAHGDAPAHEGGESGKAGRSGKNVRWVPVADPLRLPGHEVWRMVRAARLRGWDTRGELESPQTLRILTKAGVLMPEDQARIAESMGVREKKNLEFVAAHGVVPVNGFLSLEKARASKIVYDQMYANPEKTETLEGMASIRAPLITVLGHMLKAGMTKNRVADADAFVLLVREKGRQMVRLLAGKAQPADDYEIDAVARIMESDGTLGQEDAARRKMLVKNADRSIDSNVWNLGFDGPLLREAFDAAVREGLGKGIVVDAEKAFARACIGDRMAGVLSGSVEGGVRAYILRPENRELRDRLVALYESDLIAPENVGRFVEGLRDEFLEPQGEDAVRFSISNTDDWMAMMRWGWSMRLIGSAPSEGGEGGGARLAMVGSDVREFLRAVATSDREGAVPMLVNEMQVDILSKSLLLNYQSLVKATEAEMPEKSAAEKRDAGIKRAVKEAELTGIELVIAGEGEAREIKGIRLGKSQSDGQAKELRQRVRDTAKVLQGRGLLQVAGESGEAAE